MKLFLYTYKVFGSLVSPLFQSAFELDRITRVKCDAVYAYGGGEVVHQENWEKKKRKSQLQIHIRQNVEIAFT